MRKKWMFLSVALTIFVIVGSFWVLRFDKKNQASAPSHLKFRYGAYFFPIEVIKFNAANIPCVSIKIGDLTLAAKLDLGFGGNVSCLSDVLKSIPGKKYSHNKKMYKLRKAEEVQIFTIPPICIGKMVFSDMECQSDDVEFRKIGSILKDGEEVVFTEPAVVGWHLFRTVNLLLDLGNSKIAFCDSLATLQKAGYAIDKFAKSALITERGFLEFDMVVSGNHLRCALDTGSTWNIMHKELKDNQSIEQMAWDPNNLCCVPSLKINGTDFGPIDFHSLPIKLPIRVDAFLGMEFFCKHVVFIDFSENRLYFSTNSPEN